MKLNMKAGELGVIIKAELAKEHIGKIVTCVQVEYFDGVPYWQIAERLDNEHGIPFWAVKDANLRPIRDSDGEDETLAWAGKPSPIVTDKEIA